MNKEQAIAAVARFWSDCLECPRFDNGDDSPNGGMAIILARLAIKDSDPTAEQLREFRDALSDALRSADRFSHTLSVDYGPCRPLADAASRAGISSMRFPWKTVTWMRPKDGDDWEAQAALGYRAERRDLEPVEAAERAQ